jgi:hypothetical protein
VQEHVRKRAENHKEGLQAVTAFSGARQVSPSTLSRVAAESYLLFHGNALGEVARLVHVETAGLGDVIGE